MFSTQHFIWIGICAVLIALACVLLKKYRPSLTSVLTVACVGCVLSEVIKVFGAMMLVPSADGSRVYLYMSMHDLPFHFCSLQIFFIFLARLTKSPQIRETVLAFLYPTGIAGGAFAIALTTTFKESVPLEQAFTHPTAYQFFLYHSMLIVLGIYIAMSGQVHIKGKHFLSTAGILLGLGFVSIYLNSMFAVPVYENGKLLSVEFSPNFFFTYRTPIGIKLTEMWHWYVYLGILLSLVVVLLLAFYLPFWARERRTRLR